MPRTTAWSNRFYLPAILLSITVVFAETNAAGPMKEPRQTAIVAPLTVASANAEDRSLGVSLADLIAISLAERGRLSIVDRRKLLEVLRERKLTEAGLVDPATAAPLGKILAADLVVAGSVAMTDDSVRAVVTMISVEGQQIVGTVTVEGARKELDKLALELSAKAAGLAGVSVPALKPEEIDDSPVGRLHLMRGIALYYADNPDQAIVSLLQAVRLDPRLVEARLWIARCYLQLHEPEHARVELIQLEKNPAAASLADQVAKLKADCDANKVRPVEKSRDGKPAESGPARK